MSMSTGGAEPQSNPEGQAGFDPAAEMSDADFMAAMERGEIAPEPVSDAAESGEPPVAEGGGEGDPGEALSTDPSADPNAEGAGDMGNGDDPFGQDSDNTQATDDSDPSQSDDDGEADPQTDGGEEGKEGGEGEDKDLAFYKTQYEALMAPFRANNHEIKPESPEEIRELAKQGANYHKKMAGMKPHLRTLRTLEKHELLDSPKLNLLIEAAQGNKEAVVELVREAGLDPMDIEIPEQAYKAKEQLVPQAEIELDEVVEDIRESPHYAKTVDVVTKQWDQQSKQHVSQAPQILKVINDHMATGIYDLISEKVARERALGRLGDMPDLEAYRQVGDALNAQGAFDHLVGNANAKATQNQDRAPSGQAPSAQSRNTSDRESLQAQKRAASPTRASAPNRTNDSFDPLDLPDEEFMKHFNKSY